MCANTPWAVCRNRVGFSGAGTRASPGSTKRLAGARGATPRARRLSSPPALPSVLLGPIQQSRWTSSSRDCRRRGPVPKPAPFGTRTRKDAAASSCFGAVGVGGCTGVTEVATSLSASRAACFWSSPRLKGVY